MSITIGFTDFVSDRPHEDSWVIFISFDHGTKIVVRPFFTFSSFWVSGIFFKETSVVIWFLATIPRIKGLFLNQQTKFCCDLQGLWTCRVMSCTDGVNAHLLHLFETTVFCFIIFFCSKRSVVMVQGNTMEFNAFTIQRETFIWSPMIVTVTKQIFLSINQLTVTVNTRNQFIQGRFVI